MTPFGKTLKMCKKLTGFFCFCIADQKNLVSFLGVSGFKMLRLYQSVQIIRHMLDSIYSEISVNMIVICKNIPNMPRTYDYLEEMNVGIFN